jgi:hypothetical protein
MYVIGSFPLIAKIYSTINISNFLYCRLTTEGTENTEKKI